MFLECTELLVTMFLVEKMLPFEAVEIHGAKKYVEHNMAGARSKKRHEHFCRPAHLSDTIAVAVALDAICYNAYGQVKKADQYEPIQIQRELRKCLVALRSPKQETVVKSRSFITGLWGCGAFRGDMELKCVLQWMCCSLEPSIDRMVFCPFDQHQQLVKGGFQDLIAKFTGKMRVKQVLDLLEHPDYLQAPSTFQYLLSNVPSS